jgi:uncharacterized membrane protein YqjE
MVDGLRGDRPAARPRSVERNGATAGEAAPLGAVGYAALGALRHRVELAALEAAEARDHALVTGLLAGAALALGLLAGFAVTLLVAVLVWNQPWRGLVLAGLVVAEGLGAAACLLAVRARLRRWKPFAEISEQLRKDAQCLQDLAAPFAR